MDQYICFNAMQRNDVYYFAEERVNFSPFINTLLYETSKTDRIWTLRCGKRKNTLAKQINSALSPRGSSLRKSDAETDPAWSSGQHQPPLTLSIRWSLEVIHYRLMGNVITTETRKIGYTQLLYEAPHWQASVLTYRANRSQIHWAQILHNTVCQQGVYFEMDVKRMVQTYISVIVSSPSCFRPLRFWRI